MPLNWRDNSFILVIPKWLASLQAKIPFCLWNLTERPTGHKKAATRKSPETNDKTGSKVPPCLINYPNVVFDVLNHRYMLWINFILGSNFIFLCFGGMVVWNRRKENLNQRQNLTKTYTLCKAAKVPRPLWEPKSTFLKRSIWSRAPRVRLRNKRINLVMIEFGGTLLFGHLHLWPRYFRYILTVLNVCLNSDNAFFYHSRLLLNQSIDVNLQTAVHNMFYTANRLRIF